MDLGYLAPFWGTWDSNSGYMATAVSTATKMVEIHLVNDRNKFYLSLK